MPIIAALGASLLTGLSSLGVIQWQQRRQERNSDHADRFAAYTDLLARSSNFVNRAQAMRQAIVHRTGLTEGVEVTLRNRKPIDTMQLYDWMHEDFDALVNGWTKVWCLGSQQAIDAADALVEACRDVQATVSYEAKEQPYGRRLKSIVVGVRWTEDEEAEFQAALRRSAEQRAVFVQLLRRELGLPPVKLAIERAAALTAAEASTES